MLTSTKTLAVNAIHNGTVIDHIQSGQGLKIASLLDLKRHQKQITLGINLPSQLLASKDLIKIEDFILSEEGFHLVALLSPNATINIIQACEVVHKSKAAMPSIIKSIYVCPNSLCITNHEKTERSFSIEKRSQALMLQCRYCRRIFKLDEFKP